MHVCPGAGEYDESDLALGRDNCFQKIDFSKSSHLQRLRGLPHLHRKQILEQPESIVSMGSSPPDLSR